mmetsp:Transcript_4193/g.6664  ORF Transcript_4193/g.6664 Transcript_4193/m.6664 type:complete len:83 (-) Transcript_4193:1956-2204(-)
MALICALGTSGRRIAAGSLWTFQARSTCKLLQMLGSMKGCNRRLSDDDDDDDDYDDGHDGDDDATLDRSIVVLPTLTRKERG